MLNVYHTEKHTFQHMLIKEAIDFYQCYGVWPYDTIMSNPTRLRRRSRCTEKPLL